MVFVISKDAFANKDFKNIKTIDIGASFQRLLAFSSGASGALPLGASALLKWTKCLIISKRKLRFEEFFNIKNSL